MPGSANARQVPSVLHEQAGRARKREATFCTRRMDELVTLETMCVVHALLKTKKERANHRRRATTTTIVSVIVAVAATTAYRCAVSLALDLLPCLSAQVKGCNRALSLHIMAVEAYLLAYHAADISWHLVLNNHAPSRTKKHGGK